MKPTEEQMWMAIQMVAGNDAFFTLREGEPIMSLNMNDVWACATDDAEDVEWEELPHVYELWKKNSDTQDLIVWASKRRNAKPQKPLFVKLRPEIQEQLKDLPRFGDAAYPVGEGKQVVFRDGWENS